MTPAFTPLEQLLIDAAAALWVADAAAKDSGYHLPSNEIQTRLMEQVHKLRQARAKGEKS